MDQIHFACDCYHNFESASYTSVSDILGGKCSQFIGDSFLDLRLLNRLVFFFLLGLASSLCSEFYGHIEGRN